MKKSLYNSIHILLANALSHFFVNLLLSYETFCANHWFMNLHTLDYYRKPLRYQEV